ncbi:MAG TPA: hypothetical protein VH413_05930 [Verrucomicrobiae bacterium]|jgi:hypothetical protein|nr:hypothetical protein [Verrucomicrobiae bacterium]
MVPHFGKASRWNNLVETMKTHFSRLLQNQIVNNLSTPTNLKSKSGGARKSRFSHIYGPGAMPVSAFNSQLG